MGLVIGIPNIKIGAVFNKSTYSEEMKYSQTINLSAGVETDITTTVTTEPYNVFLLDSSGNDITSLVTIRVTLVVTVYHVYITSVDALNNCKLKILY